MHLIFFQIPPNQPAPSACSFHAYRPEVRTRRCRHGRRHPPLIRRYPSALIRRAIAAARPCFTAAACDSPPAPSPHHRCHGVRRPQFTTTMESTSLYVVMTGPHETMRTAHLDVPATASGRLAGPAFVARSQQGAAQRMAHYYKN